MFDISLLLKKKSALEPPKRWVNLWFCEKDTPFKDNGIEILGYWKSGINQGNRIWPSKEIAEQKAIEFITTWIEKHNEWYKIYHPEFAGCEPVE